MKPTLYIMCGLAFSGKSTLAKRIAKHLNIPRVSTDEMFEELKLESDNYEQWLSLLEISKQRISHFLADSQSVVYDHPNVKLEERNKLREIAQKAGAKAVVIYLQTPDEEIARRHQRNKETKERHDPKQEHLDAVKRDFQTPTSKEGDVLFVIPGQDIEGLFQ